MTGSWLVDCCLMTCHVLVDCRFMVADEFFVIWLMAGQKTECAYRHRNMRITNAHDCTSASLVC